MIRIVTDSTCDLPAALIERHRITVVPINVQFGTESYQEGVTLEREAFYRKVADLKMIPMTSQPSPGQFQQAYQALAADPETEAILSLHLTSHLSGTTSAAMLTAEAMPEDGPPITVFDTLSGSMGLGFMVLEAVQLAEAGAGMTEILARLETLRQRMTIFFSLDDLRYARMSGRVGAVRALLVSLLDIKPMLTVTNGELVLVRRVRSQTQAHAALIDALAEALGNLPAQVAVVHARAPESAERVREAVALRTKATEVLVRDLSIGIAVHFGPGAVGVVGYNP